MASQRKAQGPTSYSPFMRLGRSEAGLGQAGLVVDGRRRDGRSPEECRPAFVKLGTVTAATGSAYVEFGSTKVLVSVFGPRENKGADSSSSSSSSASAGQLNTQVTVAAFARPQRWAPTAAGGGGAQAATPEEQELARVLHAALLPAVQLQAFPKAVVDVMALVLEAGGSEAPVLVQCASAALADAGVPLFDLVSCASVSIWRRHLLLDPSAPEEVLEEGRLTLALAPSADLVTLMSFAGDLPPQQLSEAVELATSGCQKLHELIRTAIQDDVAAALS